MPVAGTGPAASSAPPRAAAARTWMLRLSAATRGGLHRRAEELVDLILDGTALDKVAQVCAHPDPPGARRAAVLGRDRAELVQALRAVQDHHPHPGVRGPHTARAGPSHHTIHLLAPDVHPGRLAALPHKADQVIRLGGHGRPTDARIEVIDTPNALGPAVERSAQGAPVIVVEVGSQTLAPQLVDILPGARVTATGTTQAQHACAAAHLHLWHHDGAAPEPPLWPAAWLERERSPRQAWSYLTGAIAGLAHLKGEIGPHQRWPDLRLSAVHLARLVQLLRRVPAWSALTCQFVEHHNFAQIAAVLHRATTLHVPVPAPPSSISTAVKGPA